MALFSPSLYSLCNGTSQICWLSENFPKIWRSAKRSSRTSLQNAGGGILFFLFFHHGLLQNGLRDFPFFRKQPILAILDNKLDPSEAARVKKQAYNDERHGKRKTKLSLHIFVFKTLLHTCFDDRSVSFSKVVKSEKIKI